MHFCLFQISSLSVLGSNILDSFYVYLTILSQLHTSYSVERKDLVTKWKEAVGNYYKVLSSH
jgi:hypothetical protein